MDKRQVILAYKRGLINIQECAQILGIQSNVILGMVDDTGAEDRLAFHKRKTASSR